MMLLHCAGLSHSRGDKRYEGGSCGSASPIGQAECSLLSEMLRKTVSLTLSFYIICLTSDLIMPCFQWSSWNCFQNEVPRPVIARRSRSPAGGQGAGNNFRIFSNVQIDLWSLIIDLWSLPERHRQGNRRMQQEKTRQHDRRAVGQRHSLVISENNAVLEMWLCA